MTQTELKEDARKKWEVFCREAKEAGFCGQADQESTAFLGEQMAKKNISSITMEIGRGNTLVLVPHPLIVQATEFEVPSPVGFWEHVSFYLFRDEYTRIKMAEVELSELNRKFRDYIKRVQPDPTAAVAAKLGIPVPKGVRVLS